MGVTSEKSPFLAVVYAHRNGIPPNRAHRARAPGPEILNASTGNPAKKKHDALVVERASKQYGHAHIFHRLTSSVGLVGAGGEFPVTRAATVLMHDLRRKKSTTISPALWLLSFLCSS